MFRPKWYTSHIYKRKVKKLLKLLVKNYQDIAKAEVKPGDINMIEERGDVLVIEQREIPEENICVYIKIGAI